MSKAFKLFSATVHNIDFLFGLYNLIWKSPCAHNIMGLSFVWKKKKTLNSSMWKFQSLLAVILAQKWQIHCFRPFLDNKYDMLKNSIYDDYHAQYFSHFCFVHPIFSSFGFWYFGHFSCVIFFPVFFRLAHLT